MKIKIKVWCSLEEEIETMDYGIEGYKTWKDMPEDERDAIIDDIRENLKYNASYTVYTNEQLEWDTNEQSEWCQEQG